MNRCILLVAFLLSCSALPATADSFVLQGSTTFADCLMRRFRTAIEDQAQQKLTVIPNKTSTGLLALSQRQADFAMTSGPVAADKELLSKQDPDFPFDRLRTFEISRIRMAFAVHPDNPVTSVSTNTMRRILSGEITNWRELGGNDLPIKIVMVRDGGGVQASVESEVLAGKPVSAPDQIRVQISAQVAKVVEQEPGALGLAQLNVVRNSRVKELATDRAVEQRLSLVTLGEPTAKMRDVIDATRHLAVPTFE